MYTSTANDTVGGISSTIVFRLNAGGVKSKSKTSEYMYVYVCVEQSATVLWNPDGGKAKNCIKKLYLLCYNANNNVCLECTRAPLESLITLNHLCAHSHRHRAHTLWHRAQAHQHRAHAHQHGAHVHQQRACAQQLHARPHQHSAPHTHHCWKTS